MSAILSVTSSTAYDRRAAITIEADERQESVITSVMRRGFRIDWSRVLDVADSSDPLFSIERLLLDQFSSEAFDATVSALGVNGKLIAAYIQRQHEINAGFKALVRELPREFAEPQLFEPEAAIEYGRRLLKLSDAQVEQLRAGINSFQNAAFVIRGRITRAIMERLAELYAKAIAQGLGLPEFIKQASELLPDHSRAMLEAEYRTHLTTVYGGTRHELILSRANVFPFIQFMAIRDGRTTWWICLPMGTEGPGGKGYIAATTDPLWLTWRPPNHYSCRSDLSPILYREAQRLGILAKDARTKIARVGSNPDRPFGDPPTFAEDPKTGTLRRVEPQIGFGA